VAPLEYRELHSWPATKKEAYTIQDEIASLVQLHANTVSPELIAAIDKAYGQNGEMLYVSVVITTFPEIEVVERAYHYGPVNFPYVPGLFFFREGPIIVEALTKVKNDPDLIIASGHGMAHPKQCGLACHIGIAFDKPTIGCARKLLAGHHRPVSETKGSYQPIIISSKEVGLAYRSRENVKPIFISPAHKCSLEQAREIVVQNLRGFRLPEPLRLAHLFANKYRRHIETQGVQKGKFGNETF